MYLEGNADNAEDGLLTSTIILFDLVVAFLHMFYAHKNLSFRSSTYTRAARSAHHFPLRA